MPSAWRVPRDANPSGRAALTDAHYCASSQEGRTAVHLAEAAHHADVVAVLVEHGGVATPAVVPAALADMGPPVDADWHVVPRRVRAGQRTFTTFVEQLAQQAQPPPWSRFRARSGGNESTARLPAVQAAAAAALLPLQLLPLLPSMPGMQPAKSKPRAWWAAALKANARLAVDLAVCAEWDALADLMRDPADSVAAEAAAARGVAGWLALHHAARSGAPTNVLRALLLAHPDGVEAVTDCLLEPQHTGPEYRLRMSVSNYLVLFLPQLITFIVVFISFGRQMDLNEPLFGILIGGGIALLGIYSVFVLAVVRKCCACCIPRILLTADYSMCARPRQLALQLAATSDARRLLIWAAPHTVLSPHTASVLLGNAERDAFSDVLLSGGAQLLRRHHFSGLSLLQLARRGVDACDAEPPHGHTDEAKEAHDKVLTVMKNALATVKDMHRLFRVPLLAAEERSEPEVAPYTRQDGDSAQSLLFACNGKPVHLGDGTFGSVTLFRGTRMGSPGIAAKAMMVRGGADANERRAALQHLLRDAATLRGLEHRGVAQLLQVRLAPDDGVLMMVELAGGGDLHAAVLAQPQLTEWGMCGARLATEVASALMYVHARGIFHHDITTRNILLSDVLPAGHALLTDFGIAGDARHALSDRTGSGSWAAPETYNGIGADGDSGGAMDWAAADIYSLGILCWHLLTKGIVSDKPGQISPRLFPCSACRLRGGMPQLLRPDAEGSSTLRCKHCGLADSNISAAAPLVASATAYDPLKRLKLEELHAALHLQAIQCVVSR